MTKNTDIKKAAFLKAFKKKACNISVSCEAANIVRETYYRWLREDSEFVKKVEAAKESLLDFSESMLMKNVQAGKEASVFFHLKCKGKSRGYVEKQEIEHSGLKGINISFGDNEEEKDARNNN